MAKSIREAVDLSGKPPDVSPQTLESTSTRRRRASGEKVQQSVFLTQSEYEAVIKLKLVLRLSFDELVHELLAKEFASRGLPWG